MRRGCTGILKRYYETIVAVDDFARATANAYYASVKKLYYEELSRKKKSASTRGCNVRI